MQIVLLFEQPVGNNKHPNFKWRGQWGWGGGGSGRGLWTVFYSPKLPLFRTVSQQFYRLLYFISGEFPLLFFFFFQIDDMINELKFRDYVATGKYVTEIDLGQFIRRKYCTNN